MAVNCFWDVSRSDNIMRARLIIALFPESIALFLFLGDDDRKEMRALPPSDMSLEVAVKTAVW